MENTRGRIKQNWCFDASWFKQLQQGCLGTHQAMLVSNSHAQALTQTMWYTRNTRHTSEKFDETRQEQDFFFWVAFNHSLPRNRLFCNTLKTTYPGSCRIC